MKKINPMLLLCYLFLGVLLTSKPADAKVEEETFNKYRDFYDNGYCKTLCDAAGNVYLLWMYNNNDEALVLVSTPDAKNGETTLVIPDTVKIDGKTYRITRVGADDLSETGEEVFSIGTGYKKIVFGSNVGLIEEYALSWRETLEEIEFLGDAIYVAENAFDHCENLKHIIGSEKIQRIDAEAFSHTAITHFEVSDKCYKIGKEAFSECHNLREIPNVFKVKELGSDIFSRCNGLKKIIIPNGTKKIPDYMFSSCKNLEEVYIPKSVKDIGEHIFWNCKKLKGNVTIDPKNKYYSAKDNMLLNKKGDTLLSMISPAKVMVIPSYVKKAGYYWAQDYNVYKKNFKFLLQTIIVQNKDICFLKKLYHAGILPENANKK